MAITYTWNFDSLDVHYSSASLANVVRIVHWRLQGEAEGTSSLGVSGSFYGNYLGSAHLDPVPSSDFVAYNSLTKDVVEGWVTASLGDDMVAQVTASVSESVAKQLNPPTGPKTPPW